MKGIEITFERKEMHKIFLCIVKKGVFECKCKNKDRKCPESC